jgi:hypothetical protein
MLRFASIPLPVAGFGLELLEVAASRSDLHLAAFIERAAGWWVTEADPSRLSHRIPDFVKNGGERVGTRTIQVELTPDVWGALERSAEEQHVSVELLVLHAGMCYAAQRQPS